MELFSSSTPPAQSPLDERLATPPSSPHRFDGSATTSTGPGQDDQRMKTKSADFLRHSDSLQQPSIHQDPQIRSPSNSATTQVHNSVVAPSATPPSSRTATASTKPRRPVARSHLSHLPKSSKSDSAPTRRSSATRDTAAPTHQRSRDPPTPRLSSDKIPHHPPDEVHKCFLPPTGV